MTLRRLEPNPIGSNRRGRDTVESGAPAVSGDRECQR
jgi:hypothetical protein